MPSHARSQRQDPTSQERSWIAYPKPSSTPEEGRALALKIARHTVHNIQPDLDILKGGRPNHATDPDSLIAASQVVAIEFQTIGAANNYWRSS